MEILIKSIRNIKTVDGFFWIALVVNGLNSILLDKYIKNEIGLYQIIYWLLSTILGVFVLLLIMNLFFRIWVKSRIKIFRVSPDNSYDGKILLQIKNDNYGDKFTEVKIELLKFIPCDDKGEYLKGGNGDYAYLDIKIPDSTFKKGISENEFTVNSDGDSNKIEIAENSDGILKLLFDKEWDLDVLLRNEKDMVVDAYYGISFRVSGKIAGFHFSKDFLYKIVHGIDHRSMIVSGQDGSEKPFSKIQWVL
jgi:hypothetical protein